MNQEQSLVGLRAPEFPEGAGWLNSPALQVADLQDKVVLVDFWTYSCVNCIRTLPYIRKWHDEYAEDGLVVIGVHTPEFEFEKDPANVERAVRGFGIAYPVVLDRDYVIWNFYTNHWWPRKLLLNREGVVVYDHVGEGGYEETETHIRQELGKEFSAPLSATEISTGSGGVCYPQTPELYVGYERGFIGNPRGFARDAETNYEDDKAPYRSDTVYLHGYWKVCREYVEYSRTSEGGYLLLNFRGTEVNIVGEKVNGESRMRITLDGKALTKENAGADIILDGVDSYVSVSFPRMLALVKRRDAKPALLKLEPRATDTRLYACTFGGCI